MYSISVGYEYLLSMTRRKKLVLVYIKFTTTKDTKTSLGFKIMASIREDQAQNVQPMLFSDVQGKKLVAFPHGALDS